ncbi:hypothetical protein [Mycobacterium montefiorense]|uniref:hypothetical protein n=1 Tax=Mycobacterium montefiorense TaxID=154654 RepID=UPI0021DCD550|nr:hypothetical protein [Mycobacterium montefiorense]MCV7428070.1 hypothetical protein [Mycobacterium montefiorense]GLE52529.1 hypothetical protein ATCCBAA256_20930 [Mycobacterium montefiorense]
MSDDEDLSWSWSITPEAYADGKNALEIFRSYILENSKGPGTDQLLQDTLHNPAEPVEDNALNLAHGLLIVATALYSLWIGQGAKPQQVFGFIEDLLTPPVE